MPSEPTRGAALVLTPAELVAIPVEKGNRPERVDAWPGAVSVLA